MKTHELKILPDYFKAVQEGVKTFEVRINDRDFWFGQRVILREWDPEIVQTKGDDGMPRFKGPKGYTGRSLTFKIGYMYPTGIALSKDGKEYDEVVFSLLEDK